MTEGLKTDIIINRDALFALRELPDESVNCCVTSPPYYALRDYGLDAQIGREDTPEEYIERLVAVFHELKRVLRSDGTFWLNIADTYCGTGNKGYYADPKNPKGRNGQQTAKNARVPGCKQKDLIGIPWLLAFALRADGWYLRSDIIWQKENPMPESCKDRPSRCYEHIFLLSFVNVTLIFTFTAFNRYGCWLRKDATFATYGLFGLIGMDWLALLLVVASDVVIGMIVVESMLWKIKKVPISLGVLQ